MDEHGRMLVRTQATHMDGPVMLAAREPGRCVYKVEVNEPRRLMSKEQRLAVGRKGRTAVLATGVAS